MSPTSPLLNFLLRPEIFHKVFVVYFWGRSGSYFLTSLLDNHPDLLSVAPDALQEFFPRMLATINGTHSDHPDMLAIEISKAFPKLFPVARHEQSFVASKSRYGACKNETVGIDREKFVKFLALSLRSLATRGVALSFQAIFGAVHAAHAHAMERNYSNSTPAILWNLHLNHAQHDKVVRNNLPGTRFITMVRLPEKTLDSHFKHHLLETPFENLSTLPTRLISMLGEGDRAETDAIALRFEDLHRETEMTMRALAEWMEIPWSPQLMESTFEGKTWWWNGTMTGTDPTVADSRETPYLNWMDRWKIRYAFAKNYKAWGYEPVYCPIEPMGCLVFEFFLLFPTKIGGLALAKDWHNAKGLLSKWVAIRAYLVEHWATRRVLKTIRQDRDRGKELLSLIRPKSKDREVAGF